MKWRQVAFFVILVLLGLLVVRNAGKLSQFVELLTHLNIFILLLILPARYLYYWANTRYYVHFYRLYKHELSYKQLFPGVMTMNFLNTVVPSGGISGATYFAKQYSDKITSRQSFLAQFFWALATVASIILALAGSFLILFFSNSIAQISFRLVLILISIMLAIALGLIAVTLNPSWFKKGLFLLTRPVNWALQLFKRDALSANQINRFVDGYQELVALFSRQPRRAVRPFLDAFLCIVAEILSIFIVCLAFGQLVNPGAIGAAYVLALLSSVAAFFTAGVGVYEATMVAIFVALGLSFNLAFSVTTIYRLIAFWLFLPVGLFYYKRHAIDEVS